MELKGNLDMLSPISINAEWVSKPSRDMLAKHSHDFHPTQVTSDDLINLIQSCGFAFCSVYRGSKRKNENFVETGFLALDFDDCNLKKYQFDEYLTNFASFIYTTPSHEETPHKNRFRVVFELEEPIENVEEFKLVICELLKMFPEADPACKDPVRIFFGSLDCKVIKLGGTFPRSEVLRLMAKAGKFKLPESHSYEAKSFKKTDDKKISYEEAKKMLAGIPAEPGYDVWRNLCWAIAAEFGYEGMSLIQNWSPDNKHNGRHLQTLFSGNNGSFGIGTLIYYYKFYNP